jgi:two-component system chemotaxis response regulator CheB
VGQARTGLEAVDMASTLRPDLITMDVQMPGMDGLAATREIMTHTPTPIIIVSSLARERDNHLSLEATRAGALMVLPKPEGPGGDSFQAQRSQLIAMTKAMAQVKVVRRWQRASAAPERLRNNAAKGGRARLVAIATSTGGPAALHEILSGLDALFPAPILVVQHIARGFVNGLANWLDTVTALRVKIAEPGELPLPATVYIAPDDYHLGVDHDARIDLSTAPPIGQFRPSGTFLFESVAAVLGGDVAALILTGMGNDGVAGLQAVRERGGRIAAQDEASSIVYGMPGEAVKAGLADTVLPLAEIPAWLVRQCTGGAP